MLSRIGMRDNPIHHGRGKNTPVSGEYFLTLTIDRTHQLCGESKFTLNTEYTSSMRGQRLVKRKQLQRDIKFWVVKKKTNRADGFSACSTQLWDDAKQSRLRSNMFQNYVHVSPQSHQLPPVAPSFPRFKKTHTHQHPNFKLLQWQPNIWQTICHLIFHSNKATHWTVTA